MNILCRRERETEETERKESKIGKRETQMRQCSKKYALLVAAPDGSCAV